MTRFARCYVLMCAPPPFCECAGSVATGASKEPNTHKKPARNNQPLSHNSQTGYILSCSWPWIRFYGRRRPGIPVPLRFANARWKYAPVIVFRCRKVLLIFVICIFIRMMFRFVFSPNSLAVCTLGIRRNRCEVFISLPMSPKKHHCPFNRAIYGCHWTALGYNEQCIENTTTQHTASRG